MTMLVSNATTVAERLLETRRMSGLTTRQMAEMVGTSQGTVSNWERGKGEPSISQFALWAEATKQPLSAMTEGLSWDVRPKRLELPTFCMGAFGRRRWTRRDERAFRAYAARSEVPNTETAFSA